MKKLLFLFLFVSAATFCSCTADDDADMSNTVTMKINGVSRTFEPLGVETALQQNGQYKLTIWMYANDGLSEESAKLVTNFGDTGNDGFHEFYITLNPSGFQSDATEGTFTSHISTNSDTEFEATFSGTMQGNNNTVTLTGGRIHYLYDDPLGI
ncbi:hypothetical protein [Flavobacterium pallidum]|uniref:Uncharacterized protein n=1 Tax=Flavobacterium pallidum TaxID=2172098 RepID=A0A2S1SIM0_9FLAO|nr:hypothetical protein [Flavobacterium pallidum]AWI26263.1 hypothetical protein HYN49_10315 [Flavobacterium pallidum]